MSPSEPDNGDAGPLHGASLHDPMASAQHRRFDAPLSVHPRPVRRTSPPVGPIVVVALALVVLGVLAWWFWPSTDDADPPTAQVAGTTPTESQQQAEARLTRMLPRGYPPAACEPVVPLEGALAQLSCDRNTDPGGPLTASYRLAENKEKLASLFDEVVGSLSVVDCPGNIQSPGPWRRNAAPQQTAGTLVCGFQQSKATVAWSTDDNLMVSLVQSGPQGPNMVQLYTWWSSHS